MLAYILSLKPNIMAIRNERNFELVKLFLIFFWWVEFEAPANLR